MFSGDQALSLLFWAVGLLIGITIHEASHAYSAYRLGDPTAKRLGRVTLNPLAHLDPMGTIVIVVTSLIGLGFGWGKPTPVNPNNLRPDPKTGNAIVAAAGPASNFVLATVLILLAFVGLLPFGAPTIGGEIVQSVVYTNVVLMLFNVIPIPPLDGFSILLGFLPNGPARSLFRLYQYGPGILLLLIFSTYFLKVDLLGAYLGWGIGRVNAFYSFLQDPILRALGVA